LKLQPVRMKEMRDRVQHKAHSAMAPVHGDNARRKTRALLQMLGHDGATVEMIRELIAIPAETEEFFHPYVMPGVAAAVRASTTPGAGGEMASIAAAETLGTVSLTSNPQGAEIYPDSLFVGKTPATLSLKPGRHMILLLMKDYKNWSQEITAEAGSHADLTAILEKSN
jgi:PEGA domain